MIEPIRVLIADDHPIVRRGLAVLIGAQPDMKLAAQAGDGEETVHKAQASRPHVIVMDLKMPLKDGIAAMRELSQAGSAARVLVLTSFPASDKVIAAIKAGAWGVLLKDSPPEDLLDAIRKVHRGERVLHPKMAHIFMEEISRLDEPVAVEESLTPRELHVLGLLAQGATNAEIAATLSVSVRTVTTHVRNILNKLHLTNRTEAALYAQEQGIVYTPED